MRQLRINRGITQTELAGERFSKEYVSQIERGKTRPTAETVAWLAERLGVDANFLQQGVSSSERERVESVLARAEAALEAHDYAAVPGIVAEVAGDLPRVQAPELELRALRTEAWSRMYLGEVREAVRLLERARVLTEDPVFSEVDRADVLFRLGACRYNLSSISTAVSLLTQAVELTDGSPLPCDRLRSLAFEWRSRCYQRQRDWEAAREDVERALELAKGIDDRYAAAQAHFQASLVAERQGRWVLARSHAEHAKVLYEEIAYQANVGKLLNNLGGLNFLLGKPDEAKTYLKDAFRVALDVGNDVDAGYAVSSLAQVHLRTGELELAEQQARHALELLDEREDLFDEIGNAELVLGRSLLEQGRLDDAGAVFARAEAHFDQLSSASHRAAAWIARGDLEARRGKDREAADLYRRAAEALQDFHF
ncbi:MAG: tetratricopeptide repeat protein [Thermoleophilia bacterium]|nr:tetratricopeptide repeat protein [Thermoleophilia bacterium]